MNNNIDFSRYLFMEKILSMTSIECIYEMECMKTKFCHRWKIATNYLYLSKENHTLSDCYQKLHIISYPKTGWKEWLNCDR